MNGGISQFARMLESAAQSDLFSSFEPNGREATPHHVQQAINSGDITRCERTQRWLRQEFGVNMGTGENRHEVGVVVVDYDWQALAWRVISGTV